MTDMNRAFEAQIPCLQRYAMRLARNTVLADDLVQETIARGLDKLHLWHEGTSLRAWLCTILHNEYVNEVRRSVREGTPVELTAVEEPLTRPPSQDKRLELRDLKRALSNLNREQRDAVLLIGLEGLPYEKAAEVVGVRVGTIRSRLSRGRQKLRLAA